MIEVFTDSFAGSGRLPDVIVVSACLLGMRTRYDGEARVWPEVLKLAEKTVLIPVCPEVMGGLPTPRPPAEIVGGDGADVLDGTARVIRTDGTDITNAYLKGAERVVAGAIRYGAEAAILKDRSPACGGLNIKKCGNIIEGMGVCAAALARNRIRIYTI